MWICVQDRCPNGKSTGIYLCMLLYLYIIKYRCLYSNCSIWVFVEFIWHITNSQKSTHKKLYQKTCLPSYSRNWTSCSQDSVNFCVYRVKDTNNASCCGFEFIYLTQVFRFFYCFIVCCLLPVLLWEKGWNMNLTSNK